MSAKTATVTTSLDKLEVERLRLAEAISELGQQRSAQAKRLAAAQAAAARGGDAGEAETLEAEADRLALLAERLQRGLAAVENDIEQAKLAAAAAERQAKEARLREIYDRAGKVADAIERKAYDDAASWDELLTLYAEHRSLTRDLLGHDMLERTLRHEWAWHDPAASLMHRWDTLTRAHLNARLSKLTGNPYIEIAEFRPAPSFRAALGL